MTQQNLPDFSIFCKQSGVFGSGRSLLSAGEDRRADGRDEGLGTGASGRRGGAGRMERAAVEDSALKQRYCLSGRKNGGLGARSLISWRQRP